MRYPIRLLAASILIAGISSCKKDKEPDTDSIPKTKKEMLLNGQWKLAGYDVTMRYTIEPNVTVTEDVYQGMDSCEKDDVMVLNADGTMAYYEGILKCNPNDPQSRMAGRWQLIENDTKLVFPMYDSEQPDTLNIMAMSETGLQVEYVINIPDYTINYYRSVLTFINVKQ